MKNGRHWYVIALLCGMTAASIGICNNSIGVFYTPVSESLGVLRGTFAFHATLSILGTAAITFVMPKLIEKFPFKAILWVGTALAVGSTYAMSMARTMMAFNILGLIRGIGCGMFAAMPVTMIINNWFVEKNGMATSIALSFSGLAGAIFSPFFTSCINNYGWEKAYVIMAVCILVCLLPALVLPLPLTPEKVGLKPYGVTESPEQGTKTVQIQSNSKFSYFSVPFICMAVFSLYTMISGIGQHVTGFSVAIGLSASVGATMMSLMMMGNIGAKLIIGILSDWVGPVVSTIIMMVLNVISLIMLLMGGHSGSVLMLYAASILFGSVYAIGAVGITLLVRHFFGLENYTKAYAAVSLSANLGTSLALPIIGYIYDFTKSYDGAFIMGLVINLISFVMIGITVAYQKKHRHQIYQ